MATLADLHLAEPAKSGGPQPTEKDTGSVSSLTSLKFAEDDASITLEKKPEDDFAGIMESIPAQSEAEEDAEMLQRFEQDKIRDSLLGINVGIAEFLDLPFEVSAGILRMIPGLKGVRGDPIRSLFGVMGSTPERGKEPDSAEFRIGKVVGNGIATLPIAPLGVGAQTAVQTGKAATLSTAAKAGLKETAKAVGTAAVTKPVGFVATEVVASTGAGLGMEFAQKNFPDSPTAQFLGGVIGGTAPALAPTRLAVQAGRAIKRRWETRTVRGTAKAAQEIKRAAFDLDEAARRLDSPELLDEARATAAQKSGDPGLMALERAIKNQSPNSRYDLDDQIKRMGDVVDESMKASDAAIESTRSTLADQKQYMGDLLDTNLRMAARKADEAIAKLGPSVKADQADRIARREIEAVEALARVDEKALWDVVPRDVNVNANAATTAMRQFLFQSLKSRTFKGIKNLPKELELDKLLGRVKVGKNKQRFIQGGTLTKTATMGELQDLRSDILRVMRKERAELAPNNLTLKILGDIEEALLQDMGALTGGQGTSAGDSLRVALDYSRKLKETFNRGILGKLKRVDKTGAAGIPEELTLVQAFSAKPDKAAENLRQMIRASKGVEGKIPPSQDMLGAMEDFIKTDFQTNIVRGNKINTTKAQLFLERNKKILDEFPEVRADIERAIQTEDVRAIRQRRSDAFTARVPVSRMSKATLFIEKSPRKMFESIEVARPKDFEREMNNILNKVNKDDTGEALLGLQDSFFDWIRIRSKGSGQTMDDLINTPKIAAMMGKILTKDQIGRMRQMTNTLKVIDTARSVKPIPTQVLEKGESKMLTTVMRVAGAKAGGALSRATGGGAGGLQTAAIMSERFKAVVSKLSINDPAARLLVDAFEDESGELLKMLLKEVKSEKDMAQLTTQLNAWAASVAYQSGDKALAENEE